MNWIKKTWCWMCRMILFVAMLLGIAGFPMPAMAQCTPETPANARRVDSSSNTASPDGKSWACAYKGVQDALDDASTDPTVTQLWVAEGTYYPSAETIPGDAKSATFTLVNGVQIFGGFPAGGGTTGQFSERNPEAHETILSGDLLQGGVAGGIPNCPNMNSGDCQTATPGTPGCQIADCCNLLCAAIDPFCCNSEWDSNCVLEAQQFVECTGQLRARHVITAIDVTSQTVLNGVTITGGLEDAMDLSAIYGAGIYIRPGGIGVGSNGLSDPVIVNCTFIDNHAVSSAGGAGHINSLHNFGVHPIFLDCKFIGNIAGSEGGAFCNNGGHVKFINCLFSGSETETENRDMHLILARAAFCIAPAPMAGLMESAERAR